MSIRWQESLEGLTSVAGLLPVCFSSAFGWAVDVMCYSVVLVMVDWGSVGCILIYLYFVESLGILRNFSVF